MSKSMMIELMLLDGRISHERAEELIHAHYDEVESAWVHEVDLVGAFTDYRFDFD